MIIHDLANRSFDSVDDVVVEIGKAIIEVDDMAKELDELRGDNEKLEEEVASLKSKNLELLAMIPIVNDTKKDETDETEEITEDEIYF